MNTYHAREGANATMQRIIKKSGKLNQNVDKVDAIMDEEPTTVD